MDFDNVKVKERIELSLDGRQIASVVVGALVLLGVVFVLGLNMGRQLAVKQLEGTRGDALASLDRPQPAPAPPASEEPLTYHDRLTKDPPARVEEPPPRPAPVAAAPAGPPPAQPKPQVPAKAQGKSQPQTGAARAATASFTVQLVSTPSRAEADRLEAKLQEFEPRVESAEVPGKGRVYRVRVGSFETRDEAEKLLKTLAARSGTKGLVVTVRARSGPLP